MRAVVLVGGHGTRLRPLTLDTPKQMLPIVGRPMIEHVVGHLASHGITEVVLSLGFLPDAFTDAYPDGRCAGLPLHYAVEPEPLDTAGAIGFAATHAGIHDTFLVLNGDVLTDLDVTGLIATHRRTGAEGTIALTPVEDPSRYGVVPTDDDGRVLGFIEKPAPGDLPTNRINAGTYVLEPSVLGRIDPGRRVSVERDVFPAMAAEGTLYAVASDAYWIDTGTPETYLQANLDLLDDPGGSIVAEDASVAPGASVVGSVVMAGASIGENALVEDSIVGSGARVGASSQVVGLSVLGAGAVVADGERVDGVSRPEVT
jgi:mannose-1-phosphate guanylyltransferase